MLSIYDIIKHRYISELKLDIFDMYLHEYINISIAGSMAYVMSSYAEQHVYMLLFYTNTVTPTTLWVVNALCGW